MKGIHEFIVELQRPLNDTFKTKGGLELYGNKTFSIDRLSNRIATVVGVPLYSETPIKKGYQVLIEPTILHKQIYKGVKQSYTNLIDKEKGWFRINPKMIVLYRKTENDEWKGHLQNSLCEPIQEEEAIQTGTIILPIAKEEFVKGRAKLMYANPDLEKAGATKGDMLIINKNGGLPFWMDGKEFWWVRNIDIHATIL